MANKKMKKLLIYYIVISVILGNLVSIFPQIAMLINVVFTILTFAVYLVVTKGRIKLPILCLFILNIILILYSMDVAQVSLSVFTLITVIFKNNDTDYIKVFYRASIISFIVIILLYFLFGFNSQYDVTHWRPGVGETYRRGLGFTHPNQALIKFIPIVISGLMSKRRGTIFNLAMLIITLVLYELTISRSTTYVVLFIILMGMLSGYLKSNTGKSKIFGLSFVFMLLFSLAISYFFANTRLDSFLTGRLIINKEFMMQGITLFGRSITETLDNTFVHMLYSNGLIFTIVYSILYYKLIRNSNINFQKKLFLIGILLIGFMEVILFKAEYMLLMALVFSNFKETRKTDISMVA